VSERLLALVLARKGDPIMVVPAFEEGRMREKLQFAAEVRAWQEDESPTKIAAMALADRGIRTGAWAWKRPRRLLFRSSAENGAGNRMRFR